MTEKKKKKGMTLEEFFEEAVSQAKIQAAASEEVGKFLMRVVGEIGGLTKIISEQISETLDALEMEMEGRGPENATREAIRLGARAAAFAFVAAEMSAMTDRIREGKNETIH